MGKWQLYRLDRDPSELHDRSDRESERTEELRLLWEEYAKANGVIFTRDAPAQKSIPNAM